MESETQVVSSGWGFVSSIVIKGRCEGGNFKKTESNPKNEANNETITVCFAEYTE